MNCPFCNGKWGIGKVTIAGTDITKNFNAILVDCYFAICINCGAAPYKDKPCKTPDEARKKVLNKE